MINQNLIKKLPKKSYFQLIQKVGDNGRYQWISMIILSLQTFGIGLIVSAITYFFITLSPICNNSKLINNDCYVQACSYCNGTKDKCQVYFGYINNLPYSFNTYYFCQNNLKLTIKLVQKLFVIGLFFGYLIFSYMMDNFGRKKCAIISWITTILGLIILSASWNIYVAGVGLFFTGAGISNLINFSIIFFAQQVQNQIRQYFCTIILISFCLGKTAITAIFYLLPHWRYISIILLVSSILCCISLKYLQETPRFLLKVGYQHALEKLASISKKNNFKENPLTNQDIQSINNSDVYCEQRNTYINKKINIFHLFKYKSLKFQSIWCCILTFCLYLLNYNPIIRIEQVSVDFYMRNLIISLSQLLGSLLACIIIKKPRKVIGIIIFVPLILITILEYFLNIQQCPSKCSGTYVNLTFIIVFRCVLSTYQTILLVWISEIYPQTVRGLGLGLTSAFGLIGITSIEYLVQLSNHLKFNSQIYFIIFSILGLIVTIPMKQTSNQIQLIQQIQESKNKTNLQFQTTFFRRNSLIKTEIFNEGSKERPVQSGIL